MWWETPESEPSGTIRADYEKCKDCGRWITFDRGEWIDIHGQPHTHDDAQPPLDFG